MGGAEGGEREGEVRSGTRVPPGAVRPGRLEVVSRRHWKAQGHRQALRASPTCELTAVAMAMYPTIAAS